MRILLFFMLSLLVSFCVGKPKGVEPVADFDLNRYLGTWYEIARLDHSFERNLEKVTAEYSLTKDGNVKVINKGFSTKSAQWKEIAGKAKFVGKTTQGYLKVSFFGPFYSSYIIFDLDWENYQYAFVSGSDTSYLWLLSRTPEVSPDILEKFKKRSNELGFNTEKLVLVNQK